MQATPFSMPSPVGYALQQQAIAERCIRNTKTASNMHSLQYSPCLLQICLVQPEDEDIGYCPCLCCHLSTSGQYDSTALTSFHFVQQTLRLQMSKCAARMDALMTKQEMITVTSNWSGYVCRGRYGNTATDDVIVQH